MCGFIVCNFYICFQVWSYANILSFTDEYRDADEYEDPEEISFKDSNLQVVCKIADYTFAPGDTFEGVWHYEGMAHENIVMTGLFYPASDEELGGGLEFKRAFTDPEGSKLMMEVPQTRPAWFDDMVGDGFTPLGKTTTETGKLLVFPNCHAHRVLKMENTTSRILTRRLMVFFVVDPNDRILSSKDHPPLPRKVSLEQALADRLELMKERKFAKQSLNPREIELCEH